MILLNLEHIQTPYKYHTSGRDAMQSHMHWHFDHHLPRIYWPFAGSCSTFSIFLVPNLRVAGGYCGNPPPLQVSVQAFSRVAGLQQLISLGCLWWFLTEASHMQSHEGLEGLFHVFPDFCSVFEATFDQLWRSLKRQLVAFLSLTSL